MTKITTDDKGIARFELSNDLKLETDTDGMWTFSSEFNGNDTIKAGTSEITVKDVRLEMTLTEADSIKTSYSKCFYNEKG